MESHGPDSVVYPTPAQISGTVSKMAGDFPAAEVIVVTGSGARTLAITEELRSISGKRIIASDTALYWKICEQLKINGSQNLLVLCLTQVTTTT